MQDAVHRLGNGDVHLVLLVQGVDALRPREALGHHVHLEDRRFHGVALADHRAERSVAAVRAVGRDEQVSEVGTALDVAVDLVNRREEPLHFLARVADKHADEVVPVPQTVRHPRRNRVHVLEHGRKFRPEDVVAGLDPNEPGFQPLGQPLGMRRSRAGHREVTQLLPGHLLRMARAANHADVLVRNVKLLVQVPGGNAVVLRDHPLDGRKHHLARHAGDLAFLKDAVQVQTRNGHHQDVAGIDHRLHVRGDLDFLAWETDALDVLRVVSVLRELVHRLLTTHPPMEGVDVVAQHLGDGCGPTSAAEDPDVHGRKCRRNAAWGLRSAAYLRARQRGLPRNDVWEPRPQP